MQSPIQQLLQAIQPGLTLYGVLVTFAVFSLAVAKQFWTYDKELVSENIERLRDLLGGFRGRYIEPKINNKMDAARDAAYEATINGLISDLQREVRTEDGQLRREPKDDESILRLVTEAALNDRLVELKKVERSAEKFLSSDSGQKLLDDLDHMYEQRSVLARHYKLARRACGRACYASLTFAILALVGILRVLGAWPDLVLFLWLILSLEAAVYAVYSFIRLEVHRRALLGMWEELQMYGKV